MSRSLRPGGGLTGALLACAVALCAPSPARAYSDPFRFDVAPDASRSGGGGGLYYTGSPRQHFLRCESCHTGEQHDVPLTLASQPAELARGHYLPETTYLVQVRFEADHHAPVAGCRNVAGQPTRPDDPCNVNLFALELLRADLQTAGRLCPHRHAADGSCPPDDSGETVLSYDGSVIIAAPSVLGPEGISFRDGQLAYRFYWRSPPARTGPVDLWLSAVDGNGGDGTEDVVTDVLGDGTATVHLVLGEGAPLEGGEGGCRSAVGPMGLSGALLVALWRVTSARRRRR